MPKVLTEEEVGARIEEMRRRPQRFRDDRITMAHGAGGKASRALVEGLVVPLLGDHAPASLSDPATHSAASSIAGPAGLPMTLRTYSMGCDFHGRGCAPQAGFEQMASF